MKALALALALALGGCQGIQVLTQDYNNPITKQTLYNIENTMIVAFAGLNAYKKTCDAGTLPDSCHQVIASIQVYTRQLCANKPCTVGLLADLRRFVKSNDQINARVVYSTVMDIVSRMQAQAASGGVAMGAK